MIQLKRGRTASWYKNKTKLADGQPGYDKDKHKIKIGDGEKSWSELPYASGLSSEEILSSEKEAKARRTAAFVANPLTALLDSPAVITYGTESPNKNTVGQLYLQYYDTEPEIDYVVDYGTDQGWHYKKWHSGRAECYGSIDITTTILENIGSVYANKNEIERTKYPFAFKDVPVEIATLQSPGGLIWLASKEKNTKSKIAQYSLISPDNQANAATYRINFLVSGFWR